MDSVELLRILMIAGGALLLVGDLRRYIQRKATDMICLRWLLFSLGMIAVGIEKGALTPAAVLPWWDVLILFVFLYSFLWLVFSASITTAELSQRNTELAMQVSLLNQENEQLLKRVKAVAGE